MPYPLPSAIDLKCDLNGYRGTVLHKKYFYGSVTLLPVTTFLAVCTFIKYYEFFST